MKVEQVVVDPKSSFDSVLQLGLRKIRVVKCHVKSFDGLT